MRSDNLQLPYITSNFLMVTIVIMVATVMVFMVVMVVLVVFMVLILLDAMNIVIKSLTIHSDCCGSSHRVKAVVMVEVLSLIHI